MKLRIVWLGKTRDPHLASLAKDFAARIEHTLPIEITELKKSNEAQYELSVILRRGTVSQQAFYELINNPASMMQVTDANGVAYQYNGNRTASGNDQEYRVTWLFIPVPSRSSDGAPPPPLAPSRIVWEVPTETKDVDIPFTFADLPLP